jgi:thiol-disulfide isomerase/thioredoxin
MRIPRVFRSAAILALVGVGWAPPTRGQEPAGEGVAAATFRTTLGRLRAFLNGCQTYRVEARETWEATAGDGGEPDRGGTTYELAVERPGKFAIRVRPDGAEAPLLEVVGAGADQEVMAVYRQPEKVYLTKVRRVDPIEGLRRNPVLGHSLAGSFLDLLIRPDLAEYVDGAVTGVEDMGVEDLGGKQVRHFRGFWADGREFDLWAPEGAEPLIARVRTTRILQPAAGPLAKPATLVSTVDYTWSTNEPIAAETFRMEPPEGAQEVDDLYAALTGAGDALVVGEAPPALDLALMGGGRLKLEEHAGREAVVLNFWATWYPTGVESLPTLAEFEREYGPKGIKFYHVNMAEPADLVERFVSAQPEKLAVALDPEGRATETYSVRALPFSVVVGRDGKIRAVNAGEIRGFRELLEEQLEGVVGEGAVKP